MIFLVLMDFIRFLNKLIIVLDDLMILIVLLISLCVYFNIKFLIFKENILILK